MKHIEALEQIIEINAFENRWKGNNSITKIAIGHKEETKTMLSKQMPTIVTYSWLVLYGFNRWQQH
jgi:hypothetical protein